MLRKVKGKLIALAVGATVFAGNAMAAITVPTPDYTDFEAVVGVALGVALTVMLARKAKGFLSR